MGFKHRSNNDGRFSDAIWADLPDEILHDPTVGIHVVENFANFGLVATNYYVGKAGPYKSYESAAGITQDPTALGTLKIAVAATNNDEIWLQSNGGVGVLGKIATTSPRKLWFETRVSFAQVAAQNFFVGLMEEASAADTLMADSGGALADKDYVGFQVSEAAAGTLTFTYRKAGQTAQVPITGLATLAADTYYNLGFVFDPGVNAAQRIRVYLNGAKQGTYVTAANVAAATFPAGEELSFIVGGKNNNAANTFYCQGWQFAQLY